MYPGSIFELVDQSQIKNIPESITVNNAPVFMQAFASAKGPEDFRLVEGDEFFELYGADLSGAYKKYGQPLIQAAAIINAGGRLYAKRVVPNGAELANMVIGVEVDAKESGVTIKPVTGSLAGADSIEEIKDSIKANTFTFGKYEATENKNPAITVEDNGLSILTSDTEYIPVADGDVSINVNISGTVKYGEDDVIVNYTGQMSGTFEEGQSSGSFKTPAILVGYRKINGANVAVLTGVTVKATLTNNGDDFAFNNITVTASKGISYVLNGETASTTEQIEEFGASGTGKVLIPLFIIADNGRGVSNKSFSITHDITSSKSMNCAVYSLKVYDDNVSYGSIQFVLDPSAVNGDINIAFADMINNNSTQVQAAQFDNNILDFISGVDKARKASTMTDPNQVAGAVDYLYGKTRNGKEAHNLSAAAGSTVLDRIALSGGTDGEISSLGSTENGWNMKSAFDGTSGVDIYDLDNTIIDAIVDANYDTATKNAILRLADFREDFIFLRDMGLKVHSVAEAEAEGTKINNSKFQLIYGQYFDIKDPYSKRQVPVTITYDIAQRLISHMVNARHCPLAGYLYNFICTSAIEGTVNFIPVIKPGAEAGNYNYYDAKAKNEKSELDDARINYASYYNGDLVVETEYNNQADYSQFSYANNILGIQEVIKKIRSRCPKTRYSWIDGQDLENYKSDVQAILDQYAGNYKSLTFEYVEDTTYVSNKIFYATIKVQFRNFVQTEYFKVIALPS